MKTNLVGRVGAVLLGAAGWSHGAEADLLPLPGDGTVPAGKPKVAIVEGSATLEGEERADLARSLADSLAERLLRSGKFEVVEPGGAHVPAPGTPVLTPVQQAAQANASQVLVPTLIGQEGVYKLTLRRVAVPSGTVQDLFEAQTAGGVQEIFGLVDKIAPKLVATVPAPVLPAPGPSDLEPPLDLPPAPAPPGVEPTPAPTPLIKAWFNDPTPEVTEAPRALPAKPAAKPKAQATATTGKKSANTPHDIQEVGQVSVVNQTWSFCVIRPHRGQKFTRGDQVLLRIEGFERPTIPATVTRLENGLAVAEFGGVEGPVPLVAGARAYQWQPTAPAATAELSPPRE